MKAQTKMDKFEVYTYFGRVLNFYPIPENRTHHEAGECAREFLLEYEKRYKQPCWIRYVKST